MHEKETYGEKRQHLAHKYGKSKVQPQNRLGEHMEIDFTTKKDPSEITAPPH